MSRRTGIQTNWSGGELSPTMKGRSDIEIFFKSASYMRNYYVRTEGPTSFRGGTMFAAVTRNNQKARMVRFQFNVLQSYALEFTSGFMRIYKDNALVTESAKVITNITQANPAVVTSNAHGYPNGAQVFINDVDGMDEINLFGPYTVANVTANTFELLGVNSTTFGAYSSGGTVERIVEVATPWTGNEMFEIQFAQTYDTMYVTHANREPVKIQRGGSHTAWTVKTFARTADPFLTLAAPKTITAITQANPAVVTSAAHGYTNGQTVKLEAIVGMTELNGLTATVANAAANTFELSGIDSTAYAAYVSGGTAKQITATDYPVACTFFEQRFVYGGTTLKPQTLFFSKTNGYDDMTTGVNAADGMQYTIASEEVNSIQWLSAGQKYMIAGTFGGPFKVQGDDQNALTPTNIRITPTTNFGCAKSLPAKIDDVVLFIQYGNTTLRSLQSDALTDSVKAIDANLVSDRITASGMTGISLQKGRPDIIWGTLNNGRMLGLNYKQDESVQGWFQYDTQGLFISSTNISQAVGSDQHWVSTQRTIEGVTVNMVEYFAAQPLIPRREDYFIDPANEAADLRAYEWALYEAQKSVYHVDCGLTASGLVTGATVTPAAVTGSNVVFTASASIFQASDVGREIWAYGTEGRARIISYTNPTTVNCEILQDFNSTAALPTSGWYLTFDQIVGMTHLEGKTVRISVDGGTHPDKVVTDATVQLDQQVSVAHVGLGYDGLVIGQNIELGGDNGPAQTKPRNISKIGVQFVDSLECQVGTNFYDLERLEFYQTQFIMGKPPLLTNGSIVQTVGDSWTEDKYLFIYQNKPLPSNVLAVVPYMATNDT